MHRAVASSAALWSRRAKIDIHDLPAELLEKALAGSGVEAYLPGRAKGCRDSHNPKRSALNFEVLR
jgi:Family of unknown function (DUF5990)